MEVRGLPLMHPLTRMGRAIQQLRSFGDLHAGELDGLADELEASGSDEYARRLRVFRDMQRGEGQMVIDALVELQGDMAAETQASHVAAGAVGGGAGSNGSPIGGGPTTVVASAAGDPATGASGSPAPAAVEPPSASGGPMTVDGSEAERTAPSDPAVNSPRRAKWLAEQAAEAERLRQPFSRRDLFGRGTPRSDA